MQDYLAKAKMLAAYIHLRPPDIYPFCKGKVSDSQPDVPDNHPCPDFWLPQPF